jgi:hypothetical protein
MDTGVAAVTDGSCRDLAGRQDGYCWRAAKVAALTSPVTTRVGRRRSADADQRRQLPDSDQGRQLPDSDQGRQLPDSDQGRRLAGAGNRRRPDDS